MRSIRSDEIDMHHLMEHHTSIILTFMSAFSTAMILVLLPEGNSELLHLESRVVLAKTPLNG